MNKKIREYFSLKDLLNSSNESCGKKLTIQEIKQLQQALLVCYQDIYIACNKHGIKPFLQGGTLLGKIRHNGFIPWDDDLDLGMIRFDYEKFKSIFDEELSEKYILKGPGCQAGVTNRFIQVFRKDTVYKTIESSKNIPAHIYIDIFPIDYAPDNRILRIIKGTFCNGIMLLTSIVSFNQNYNANIRKILCQNFRGKVNLYLRLIPGRVLSIIPAECWYAFLDKIIQSYKKTSYYTSATGRKHYLGEVIGEDVLAPLKATTFEKIDAWLMNKPDFYLQNLYGDFMEIPPLEKREEHFITELKIDWR